jgi:hypothetical protein
MTGERSSGWLVVVGDERKEAVGRERRKRKRKKTNKKQKNTVF